jgi:nucleotide-binding universal stress UspA family protein
MRSEIKILIAYDGKETSPPIFDDLKLAGLPSHAEAVLLSVGELWLVPPSLYGMYEPDYTEEFLLDLKNSRILAEKACERIAQFFPDWNLQPEAGLGSPVERILEIADKIQPDLIVVGSHGRTALGRIVIGSVSQKIVTEAHCSVRVAREHSIKEDHPHE